MDDPRSHGEGIITEFFWKPPSSHPHPHHSGVRTLRIFSLEEVAEVDIFLTRKSQDGKTGWPSALLRIAVVAKFFGRFSSTRWSWLTFVEFLPPSASVFRELRTDWHFWSWNGSIATEFLNAPFLPPPLVMSQNLWKILFSDPTPTFQHLPVCLSAFCCLALKKRFRLEFRREPEVQRRNSSVSPFWLSLYFSEGPLTHDDWPLTSPTLLSSVVLFLFRFSLPFDARRDFLDRPLLTSHPEVHPSSSSAFLSVALSWYDGRGSFLTLVVFPQATAKSYLGTLSGGTGSILILWDSRTMPLPAGVDGPFLYGPKFDQSLSGGSTSPRSIFWKFSCFNAI